MTITGPYIDDGETYAPSMSASITAPYVDDGVTYAPAGFASPSSITAPFLDGGVGFGPVITSTATAYPALDLAPVGEPDPDFFLTDTFNRTFRDVLNDAGSFGWSAPRVLPYDPAEFDNETAFLIDLQPVFFALVEAHDHVAIDPEEGAGEVINVAGRGGLAKFEQMVVYPSRGVETLPIEEVRSFSWPSPDFDSDGWPLAKLVNRQREYADWRSPLPWVWPDTTGYWIWGNVAGVSSTLAPLGTCLFRKTFTLADDAVVRIFSSFDNDGTLYLDGAEMNAGGGFETGKYFTLELTAGDHVIAARATNRNKFSPGPNPGGFICAVYTVGDGSLLDELVTHTDATWSCLPYPTTMPGFTHGQVFRTLIEEAQEIGSYGNITMDFTDTLDSAGNEWGVYREITVEVGRTLFDVFREMSEGFNIDIALGPGSNVFRAWADGGRGETRSVTLTQTTDPATSDFLSLNHAGKRARIRTALVRYGGGWLEEVTPATLGPSGYLELGAVKGEAEAREMARQIMANRIDPAYTTVARLCPSSAAKTPYTAFWPGDVITCPDETDTPAAMRVRAITMTEDENGVIEWLVELRDLAFEIEERVDTQLRRMADGALMGGARVSSKAGTPAPIAQEAVGLDVARFSYGNDTLTTGYSEVEPSAATKNIVEVVGTVTTPGSTSTVVTVTLGQTVTAGVLSGSVIATLTIPAGEQSAEVPLTIVPIRANVDRLQARITSAGVAAEGLVVQVRAL